MNVDERLKALGRRVAEELLEKLSEARAVVVATEDGFELAFATREELEAARIAAMTSSIAAICDSVSREAGLGHTKSFVVEASDGFMVMRGVQNGQVRLVLSTLTRNGALLGMVMNAVGESARALSA
ncbi:MAG TPA: roadblock/LC7 domain-containing protein [Burkholderiales bacterium]